MTQPDAGDMIDFAPLVKKYAGYPGNATRVYRMLCDVLADRASQVDWGTFTPDDWRMILPMAEAEGVAPLLWWKLRAWGTQSDTDALPAGVQALVTALAPAYYETLAHNTLLLQALERILKAFQEAGIEVIVLKGAALAQTVYEDIGLRPMNDLDLLVRPKSLRKAVKVLQGLGFAPLMYSYARYHVFLRQENLTAELQWNLLDGVQHYELWSQAVPLFPWTDGVLTLNTQMHLLYLAGHAFWQHQRRLRLIWLYDLRLVAGKYRREDWETLLQRTASSIWQPALLNALTALKTHFGDDLPDMPSAGDSVSPMVSLTDPTHRKFIKMWRALDWGSRIHMIAQGLFPPAGYMRWRYNIRHSLFLPLYYPYRWFDLLSDILRV